MQSSVETIKNLLRHYQFYKMQAENGLGGLYLKEKMRFIENSISVLNEQDFKLVKGMYIDEIPVTKIANSLFIHRVTAYRRAETIIANIAKVYEMQYKE